MRHGLALFAITAVAIALTGCGFKPLYGDRGVTNIGTELANIDVSVEGGDGEVGRLIKYNLLDSLSSAGASPGNPDYRVDLVTSYSEDDVAIQKDAEVTRKNVSATVSFRLVDTRSGQAVFHSVSRARTSYNRVDSEFANIAASQDAQRRTAMSIADDIKLQIAVYLDSKASKEAS